MNLFLIRHGHDLPSPGGEPQLSKQGRAVVRSSAEAIRQRGITHLDVAIASPALRCQQSLAEIIEVIDAQEQPASVLLAPDSTPQQLVSLLLQFPFHDSVNVLVVGHEPQLSNSVLRWGGLPENDREDPSRPPWILKRGEGMSLRPVVDGSEILIHALPRSLLGVEKRMPVQQPAVRTGVF